MLSRERRFRLRLAFILAVTFALGGAACLPRTRQPREPAPGVYEGIYIFGWHAGDLQPCGVDESWAVQGHLLPELVRRTEEIDPPPADMDPAMVYRNHYYKAFVRLRGIPGRVGEGVPMGSTRTFTGEEILQVSPTTGSTC